MSTIRWKHSASFKAKVALANGSAAQALGVKAGDEVKVKRE